MTTSGDLPALASRHARALLRFPDPRTAWVVVTVATLSNPADDLAERLDALHAAVPIVGARLEGETWLPGSPPTIEVGPDDLIGAPGVDRPFDLSTEAPLRLVRSGDGRQLAVVGHHAAFDGLALVGVLRALTGGEPPGPVDSPPPGPAGSKLPLLGRLVRPADPVTPTPGVWPGDAYATERVALGGKGVTGRIAAAAVAAAAAHDRRHGRRLRKAGVTVAVGGPAGIGNVASYRRIDVGPRDPVAALVDQALATPEEPGEQVRAPKVVMRLLEPVVDRFSDTVLISNLGRHRIDGVEDLSFFPVARGRSAVCIGSAAIEGAGTTLSIRARDLSPGDARRLLADTVERLAAPAPAEA